jgi:Tfp pilus assembly protein PilF
MKKLLDRLLRTDSLLQLALFASLAIYLQTAAFAFVYDDFGAIVMNPWLASWHGLPQIFLHHSWAFMDFPVPARHYRPMFLVWLFAVRHVFAPSPAWYHLCALFTHLCAACLAYRLAKVLLRDELGAAIAVVLFATHPTKVEAVAWISAVSDPLMAVFFFGAVLTYIRSRARDGHCVPWAVASFLCALAALLTKETAAVLPGVILAYEWLFHEPGENKHHLLRLAGRVSPYLLADGLWLGARFLVLRGAGDGLIPGSMKVTLLTMPAALWLYIRQLVWPVNLSALYPDTTVTHFSVLHTVLPVAALVLLAATYRMWSRRSAVLQFAGVWFLLTLAPVIYGFPWIQLHDRHLYLPSFAVALMLAVGIRQIKWPGQAHSERLQVAGVMAIALLLSVVSAREARAWDSELTVFTRAVSVSPRNVEAVTMLAQAQADNGEPRLALETLQNAVLLQPESSRLVFTLGNSYYEGGDYVHARPLLEKLTHMPSSADYRSCALYDLGMMELQQNHYAAAKSLLRTAIKIAPNMSGYQRILDNLQRTHPQ